MVDRIAPITGPTGYDYGRTPGLFDIAGLLDAFTPTRREIISPSQTRFEEMDGLMYPVTTPAVYGEPETGIEYMPAYRAASSAADFLGGLLTGGDEEREMLVEGAKAVPGALAGQIDDYYTAMTQTPEGASGLVTPEGEVIEANPLLPMEYLLGGSIGAMRAGDNVLGAAGGRVRPPTKGELDPLGYGAVKLDRAVPDIDVRVMGTNQPNLPRRRATIEDVQGKVIMPFYGDKSSNRGLLMGIDEIDLARPVLLEGGPDFMVGPAAQAQGSIWASGKGVVSTLKNRADQLAEETGRDVVGATITMAPNAVDFTTFMSRALAEQIPSAKIKKKDMKVFDAEMKRIDKEWPGVGAENLGDYLANVAPDIRKAFVRLMDKKPAQEAGFPSVGKTRVAVTEPDLIDVPAGRVGFAMGQIDPNLAPVLDPLVPHSTYDAQIIGEYLGGFETPIPQGLLFRDAYKGMEGRTYFDKKLGREVPFSEATKAYTMKTQLPGQIVDQELVDAIMQYSLLGE